MTHNLLAAVALLLSGVSGHTADLARDIDALARDALRQWNVPGVAVVVVRDGQTLVLQGYGTKRLGAVEPITPDTLFPLGSCTKALTSALLASLQDDGKAAFDDPVRKHLPAFHLQDRDADSRVTLRDLLAHRTGVAGHDYLWYRAPWDRAEVIRRIALLPQTGRFRDSYDYSSIMVMAAGQAMANAGGKPWEELLAERVTKPLGMANTVFTSVAAARFADRASGHERDLNVVVRGMPEYVLNEANPAGSAFTTPRDIVPWMQLHLNGGTHNGRRVISEKNLQETRTVQVPMPKDETIGPVYPDSAKVGYAMGWVVYDYRGREVVAHGGVMDGFRTQIMLVPGEKVGVALFNNLHQTKMNIALGHAILDRLLEVTGGRDWNAYFLTPERVERERTRAALAARQNARRAGRGPSVPLEQFAGSYSDPAYGEAKVTHELGRLVWAWSGFRSPLSHFEGDTFRVTEGHFTEQLIEFTATKGAGGGAPGAFRFLGVPFTRKP